MRGVRISCAIAAVGAALVLLVLAGSRSSAGVVLGMWSPALTAGMLLVLLIFLLSAATALGFRGMDRRIAGRAAALPELAGPQLLFLFPAGVFLLWFLSLFPVFLKPVFLIGALLLSVAPGLLLMLSRTGSELKRVLAGTAVMAVSLVLVILVGEFLLGRIMPKNIFNPRFGLRPYSRTVMRVELPGITPGGIMSTNMWGFRGEDPPENWEDYITIVAVGGSTTANYYLDDSLTWSHVLQEELREENPLVWVGNAGIPRHSSDTHLLFVREVLSEIQPDIALFLLGVNDMGPFLRSNADEERLPDSGPRQWLFSNSRILQLIYKAKVVHLDRAPVVTAATDPKFTEEPLEAPEDPLPEDLHSLLEDPDFFRRRIALLIEECRSLGITPVFLTQPILYQDNDHWRGIRATDRFAGGEECPISAATFAGMLGTLNRDLMLVCREKGVPCFDLAGNVPGSREYFYDAMHMTEAGADLVGRLVAGFLREYLMEGGMPWRED